MCLSCQESWDCPKCKKRRPLGVSYPCSSCGMLRAVWCSDCYEANAIELRLCGRCVESADRCAYCHRSSSDNCSVSVVECSRHECSHVVMICDTCVHSCRRSGVSCRPCWRKDKKCIVCCDRPAQTAMGYGGRCSTCLAGPDAEGSAVLLREEAITYCQRVSESQKWDGTESGLQVLHLPSVSTGTLPTYASTPAYLSPSHCRLCLCDCRGTSAKTSGMSRVSGAREVEHSGSILRGVCDDESDGFDLPEDGVDDASGVSSTKACSHGVCAEVVEHLRSEHGLSPEEYRAVVLRRELGEWPSPISPQVLRTRLAAFKEKLNDEEFLMGVCASCAREKRRVKLLRVTFPRRDAPDCPEWLPWTKDEWPLYRDIWFQQIDALLGVEQYMQQYFQVDERVDSAREELAEACRTSSVAEGSAESPAVVQARAWLQRVESWRACLYAEMFADGVPVPGNHESRWVLYVPGEDRDLSSASSHGALRCDLCSKCRKCFSALRGKSRCPNAVMPRDARANGLWRGPDPPEIAALSFADTKVIQRARLYISIKRVFLNAGSFARTSGDEVSRYHERNVVAFPQNPDGVYQAVALTPSDLARTLLVQFVGSDRSRLRYEPTLTVDVSRLRAAFAWLVRHNWLWMQATKSEFIGDPCVEGSLGERLEEILAAYKESVGGDGHGVPTELLQAASRVDPSHVGVHQPGPADSVAKEDGEDDENPSKVLPLDGSAGIIEGDGVSLSGAQLWDSVMKQYRVFERCAEEMSAGNTCTVRYAQSVHATVAALSRLAHEDVRKRLEEFHRLARGMKTAVLLGHDREFLSSFDSDFWPSCFVHLFPRGDCQERVPKYRQRNRHRYLPPFIWAKVLLTRSDYRGWRMDVEFIACVYNVFLRREQMRSVYLATQREDFLSPEDAKTVSEVTSLDFVSEVLASGDCNSVHEVLRRKNLDVKLRRSMETLQLCQRRVRGSDSEKGNMVFRFTALRIFNGCSSLFFTLNPNDIRSPLMIGLVNAEHFHIEKFSLDLEDAETEAYFSRLLGSNPRKLHEMVAQDPLAATRCFHLTVRLVIDTLFNCTKPGEPFPDGIPAREVPGVFGYIAGYLGVVEPQMRKALHLHMLIQLHGFAHPRDIFGRGRLLDTFRRLWRFIASICFRSTEAFADFLGEDAAKEALRAQPLLSLTESQRRMIGEARVRECMSAQLDARGLTQMPKVGPRPPAVSYTPLIYASPYASSSEWARFAAVDVLAMTLKAGNHVCRADVCHKGRIGRLGFCRMLFWHWARMRTRKGKMGAERRHGLLLQERWSGEGAPPVQTVPPCKGSAALQVTTPFPIKLTPSVFLGPRCNHDLGVLLRFPVALDTLIKAEEVSGGSGVECVSDSLRSGVLPPVLSEPGFQSSLSESGGGHGSFRDSEHTIPVGSPGYQPVDGTQTGSWCTSALDDEIKAAAADMMDAITDHEFYCATYASKEGPHIKGLLLTLLQSVQDREKYLADLHREGKTSTVATEAKAILNRLLSATNNRMHKGFPEMLSYLLRKPSFYCSHRFVICSICRRWKALCDHLLTPITGEIILSKNGNRPSVGVTLLDYVYRPTKLERFPFYFFCSACVPVKEAGSGSLPWMAYPVGSSGKVRRHPAYSQFGKVVMSSKLPTIPLRDPETGDVLHEYPYFLKLLVGEPWRVPLIYGKIPVTPAKSSTDEEKGKHALYMMLLFRPWREYERIDFLNRIPIRHDQCGPASSVWKMVSDEYVRWRADEIDSIAAPYLSRRQDHPRTTPKFDSQTWWSCMISLRLRNIELVASHHRSGQFDAPNDISTLPEVFDTFPPHSADHRDEAADAPDDRGEESGCVRDSFWDAPITTVLEEDPESTDLAGRTGKRSYSHAALTRCTPFSENQTMHDFLSMDIQERNTSPENRYLNSYCDASLGVFRKTSGPASRYVNYQIDRVNLSSEDVRSCAQRQRRFFIDVDKYEIDHDEGQRGLPSHSPWSKAWEGNLQTSLNRYHGFSASTTIVMEAAFSLVESGLFQIPDVGINNVKQCRAFLCYAWWLQKRMVVKWYGERKLLGEVIAEHDRHLTAFQMIMIGPGGTGKTTVLKVAEALANHFNGDESVRKCALSNTAARLLGGDTIHALCKLPRRALRVKGGILSSPVLRQHRKRWQTAISVFVDEVSMLAQGQFLEADVRMRQAKEFEHCTFGALGAVFTGDFLQLPPVDRHGLALEQFGTFDVVQKTVPVASNTDSHALPVEGEPPVEDGKYTSLNSKYDNLVDAKDDEILAEELVAEARQGLHLWRGIENVVSLTVNVRAPGVLSKLQAEMRRGHISNEMWELYMSRVLRPDDKRPHQEPFCNHPVRYVVHRHRLRVRQSYKNAVDHCARESIPLYLLKAADEVRAGEENAFTPELQAWFLHQANPRYTKHLSSFLPLYIGMRLLLYSKDCVRLGLMNGCECILEHIVFADEEVLPTESVAGTPHLLEYMPVSLILRAVDAPWSLTKDVCPDLPNNSNRRGLFQLRPTQTWLKVKGGQDKDVHVRRTTFAVLCADSLTVYQAQGESFDAVIADMERPPKMDADTHWLACYVMLSRARTVDGLLILRPAKRAELSRRPPSYLVREIDRLLDLEKGTTERLHAYISSLPRGLVPDAVLTLFVPNAEAKQLAHVESVRGGRVQQDVSTTSMPTSKLRASKKTLPDAAPSSSSKRTLPTLDMARLEKRARSSLDGISTKHFGSTIVSTHISATASSKSFSASSFSTESQAEDHVAPPLPCDVRPGPRRRTMLCENFTKQKQGDRCNECEGRVHDTALGERKVVTCTKRTHRCSRDVVYGCASCSQMCHATCESSLCKFQPCPFCLCLELVTHQNSNLCVQQQANTGCHACGHLSCWATSASCAATSGCPQFCTRTRHICARPEVNKGCTSCGKSCHENNSDFRCMYFRRSRDDLGWDATPQELLDTQPGTGGSVPHSQQVHWEFDGVTTWGATKLVVDGVRYFVGRGDPGDACIGEYNNCLIDSLRQCLGIKCDCRKVRADLMAAYGNASGRAKVTLMSYLDVDSHWETIIASLFRHNKNGLPVHVDLGTFCVVALDRHRCDHGVVLGGSNSTHVERIVVLNAGDIHFDPCIKFQTCLK